MVCSSITAPITNNLETTDHLANREEPDTLGEDNPDSYHLGVAKTLRLLYKLLALFCKLVWVLKSC